MPGTADAWKGIPPVELVFRVLQSNQTSSEPAGRSDLHVASKLIAWLQENPGTPSDVLAQIEWNYLPFLQRQGGGSPKTLMRRLAQDPAFFCQIIRAAFRSKSEADETIDDRSTLPKKRKRLVETPFRDMAGIIERAWQSISRLLRKPPVDELSHGERKRIAENAFRLLHEWHLPPGSNEQRQFDEGAFRQWVAEVKRSTTASGHFGVAMSQFGQVLTNCNADPSGLWIHRAAADVLNAKDGSEMRRGFTCKLFNMRGVHSFSAGKQERELAARYRQGAKDVEDAGFHRLATALRDLAISYEDDAEREAKRGPLGE